MVKYEIVYFPFNGMSEPLKYMLEYLGEPYEIKTIPYDENWPSVKPTIPFGKLPLLVIDGEVFHQTVAICRYLGAKANLIGNNEKENLHIDMLVDAFVDLEKEYVRYYYEEEKAKKQELLNRITNTLNPLYFGKLDELVSKNAGYIANGRLSWGDLYIMALTDVIFLKEDDSLLNSDKYSNVLKLRQTIQSLPQLKSYFASKPAKREGHRSVHQVFL